MAVVVSNRGIEPWEEHHGEADSGGMAGVSSWKFGDANGFGLAESEMVVMVFLLGKFAIP